MGTKITKNPDSASSDSSKPKKKGFFKMLKGFFVRRKSMEIESPFGFEHKTHIVVDVNSPCGLSGLPDEWRALLESSDITKDEVIKNGDAVINALAYQFKQEPIPTAKEMMDVDAMLRDKTFIREEDPKEFYLGLNEVIGEGGFSTVYKAVDMKTENTVAMKVTSLSELVNIRNELALQKTCHHSNIVFVGDCFNWRDKLWIVMEFMEKGSLTGILGPDVHFEERFIAYVCQSILRALDSLHRDNRIHRDIKSDNILINGKGEVKLADFGFAVRLTSDRERRKSMVGTPFWMAPELIRGVGYDCKVDIWSLGITALEMADGEPPYYHDAPLKALLKIHTSPSPKPQHPEQWSAEFNDFLAKALDTEPATRASAAELLEHPFLQKACGAEEFLLFANDILEQRKNQ